MQANVHLPQDSCEDWLNNELSGLYPVNKSPAEYGGYPDTAEQVSVHLPNEAG